MRAALASLVVLVACGAPARPEPARSGAPAAAAPAFRATVRWTSDGVPHVRADDWAGLGFGQGYAMAKLHVCVLADQIVRVRGERARYFGPGDGGANLDSDFFHLHLGYRQRAKAALDRLSPEAKQIGRGFVAGYNHYVAVTPRDQLPSPCRGADWVRPIDELDLTAHGLALTTIASSRAFEALIAKAAPRPAKAARAHLPARDDTPLASNAWAFGAERTAHGGGLVVANPHFPWEGDLLFYESHLTIPGQLDVYGAALVGAPLVNIGFTRSVAWSHTFSSSTRFVVYRLKLVPGQPMRYVHGDEQRPILPATYTIQVRKPDGTLEPAERTLYRTDLGPMIDSAELPWDPATGAAYALRDVAYGDGKSFDEYLAMARAPDLDAFERALSLSGTPFVNTVAADRAGEVLYVDGSRVPALSTEALLAWQIGRRAIPELDAAWRRGVFVADGSKPLFDLINDDPRAPGAVAIAAAPRMRRRDVVMNANDSYRYTHPTAQLPDASPLYGDDAGRPSPRTLMNLRHVADGSKDAGDDGRWTRQEAAAAVLSSRSYTAEALRAEILERCKAAARKKRGLDGRLCAPLAAWDGRFTAASRGAALWRELMVELAAGGGVPWARPYDPAAPAAPLGLAPGLDVVAALERAATRLEKAGVAPTAPLGEVQRALRGGSKKGVPGGSSLDGTANVVLWVDWNGTLLPRSARGEPVSRSGLAAGGWTINYGTSFVMTVELTADGPHADVLLTYGNSSDPASPHYRDQLDEFAAGRLRPARFTDAEIAADPGLVTEELSAP